MAKATVTLATTTLSKTLSVDDPHVVLASLTGIVPGNRLYIDREILTVLRLTGIGNELIAKRGGDSTASSRHGAGAVVTIGRPDQFYSVNPTGLMPAEAVPVLPYINVQNGTIWTVQGDDGGPGADGRIWAQVTTTQTIGPLGVRVTTTTTPT
jgi:hypothetical protein